MVSLNNGILISFAPAGNSTFAAVAGAGVASNSWRCRCCAAGAAFVSAACEGAAVLVSNKALKSSPALPTMAMIWFTLAASPAGTLYTITCHLHSHLLPWLPYRFPHQQAHHHFLPYLLLFIPGYYLPSSLYRSIAAF
jgi:hypothetical protein